MAAIFKADEAIMNTVKDLIQQYHPHLLIVMEEIAVVFKEKASTVGEITIPGKTSKAGPMISVLAEKEYKFIITLAMDEWDKMPDEAKLALLDHHLCACGVEDKEDGSIKTFIKVPEVAFFKEEFERHGAWRTSGAAPSKEMMQEIFG